MRTLTGYLAWKYLKFTGKDKSISFMIKICFAGIFIGSFALMMTLIITNGFEKTIHEKMQGINAQAVMYAPGSRLDYNQIVESLMAKQSHLIAGASGSSVKQVIIDQNKSQTVLFIKGIDTHNEQLVTTIFDKITKTVSTQNRHNLTSLLKPGHIIIGHKTAHQFHLKPGDSITVMIPEAGGRKRINLSKQQMTVAGIFKIGLEEYDNNFAFAQLDYVNELFEDKGVESIALKFKPGISEEQGVSALQEQFPFLTVQSWKQLYPALVSSLKLEKYVMFLIIALVSLVATMNMISLLFMQVQQKRRDIAIYAAMGMQPQTIQSIFLRLGMMITCSASVAGLACAAIGGYILERYPFIELPDVYYVSHLPARMELSLFLIVFATTLLLGFIATWLPARQARKLKVAQVLRQEG